MDLFFFCFFVFCSKTQTVFRMLRLIVANGSSKIESHSCRKRKKMNCLQCFIVSYAVVVGRFLRLLLSSLINHAHKTTNSVSLNFKITQFFFSSRKILFVKSQTNFFLLISFESISLFTFSQRQKKKKKTIKKINKSNHSNRHRVKNEIERDGTRNFRSEIIFKRWLFYESHTNTRAHKH